MYEAQRKWIKDATKHIIDTSPKLSKSECFEYLLGITPMMVVADRLQSLCRAMYEDDVMNLKQHVHQQTTLLWGQTKQCKMVFSLHAKETELNKKNKKIKEKRGVKQSFTTPSQIKRKYTSTSKRPAKRQSTNSKTKVTHEEEEEEHTIESTTQLNSIASSVERYESC